jgi:phosphate transport system permease protein
MAGATEAGERAERTPAGTETVSRRKGRLFELACLGATVFGILMVTVLLLYVANDAFRPASADLGWHLTFVATVVVPALALVGYYLRTDRAAAKVAYESLGVPVVGALLGAGLAVLFVEIVSPFEWTALLVGLLVAAGVVYAHVTVRPAAALERLFLLLLAPLLSVFGIPEVAFDVVVPGLLTGEPLVAFGVRIPGLVPGIPELILATPVKLVDWFLLVVSVTLPAALVAGSFVAARRDDGRGLRETVVAALAVVVAGAPLAPLAGLASTTWVLLATSTLLPLAVYVEGVLRRGDGVAGFLFPVVVAAGVGVGVLVVESLGFAGPDVWLDWQFLTSAHSRTPGQAGIYPSLVGSVLMLVVIVVSAFPVGVGAAVYLEEYAPSSGPWASVVELIEVNIGNLAGVPSVVYGLLGLALFVRGFGFESGIVIVGGFTVGLLILPIVIISAQEAIRGVPDSMRQASYGMGATRWQTVRNVVLPEAMPGILTGTILALGRAIGETAPLLMIGAPAVVRRAPEGFFSKFSAMPRQIFSWSHEIQEEFRFGVLAAGVVTLVVVLLLMNGSAILIRNKYQRGT